MRRLVLAIPLVLAASCSPEVKQVRHSPMPLEQPIAVTREFAVPVLMYHRVSDLTEREARSPLMRDLTVSPADFEEQVKYLKDQGFTFLFARQVEEALQHGKPLPKKAVALTFDDGYKDNFSNAFPILKRYGAKATIFIVTNNLRRPGRLTWPELHEMSGEGVGYGSHTVSHPDLTTLSSEDLRYELRESKRILEEGLSSSITSVAYPAGQYNGVVAYEAREAGYLAGWKKGGGPVEPRHAGDLYLLPRVRVHGRTTATGFKRKVLSGVYVQELRLRQHFKRLLASR
ncbi:MAG TPA: polysaccharide deacetylase family protein [Fimbriimonadaceae bacterium]|nr:polysaccharide deacetylase family protein [Fimbriimonadaceae bacterium]